MRAVGHNSMIRESWFDFVAALAIASTCLAEPAQADSVRLFFDRNGTPAGDNAPHPGPLAYVNPELSSGGRLFIYAQFHNDGPDGSGQVIERLNFDVTVEDGIVTSAWNYNGPGQNSFNNDRRWDEATPNPVIHPDRRTVSFSAFNLTHFGLANGDEHELYDVQHNPANWFGDTLLGYVDVAGNGNCGVWFSIGEGGIHIRGGGPDDDIFFGFGDHPVRAGDIGSRSSTMDAGNLGPCCNPCDANCDWEVNAFDIEPFLELLFDPNATPCDTCSGDANRDGEINSFDIEPFLECLFP